MKIIIAAYGTLRKGYGNSRLVDKGDNHLGTGLTEEKYTMYSRGIPFVKKEKNSDTNIVVDLWEINESQLHNCDMLEGHPHAYERQLVNVIKDGEKIEAWLYFYNHPLSNEIKKVKSGDYADQK